MDGLRGPQSLAPSGTAARPGGPVMAFHRNEHPRTRPLALAPAIPLVTAFALFPPAREQAQRDRAPPSWCPAFTVTSSKASTRS